MAQLPDEALVVRGGENLPVSFITGAEAVDSQGKVQGVSVNSATALSIEELTGPNAETGYPGIPHGQVGVCTVGEIRRAGGEVVPLPTPTNPHHATLGGLTPDRASLLFRPTIPNPRRRSG